MNNLHPYVPGEQPDDREYIKLNANENPYPPCQKVVDAAIQFLRESPQKLSLYPDPDAAELHRKIADMLNRTGGVLSRAQTLAGNTSPSKEDELPFTVTPEMIYTGNGSDEVLSFVFYAFFDSKDKLVCPEFSYSFYPVYCGFYGIPRDPVPLKKDWTIDIDAMIERANKNHSATIVANPNAPTSVGISRSEMRQWIKKCPEDRAFIVDEAYVDFGGESCIPLLNEFSNLVIVRTFSKSLSGAGLRCGYIVSNPELVKSVTTVKNSLNHFPLDAFTQATAKAVCDNDSYYVECAKKIAAERDDFIKFLAERNWTVLPSSTNFVFCKKDGVHGKAVYEALKKSGILVRRFDTPGIEEYLRITVGTGDQMDALKTAIKEF